MNYNNYSRGDDNIYRHLTNCLGDTPLFPRAVVTGEETPTFYPRLRLWRPCPADLVPLSDRAPSTLGDQ